MMTKIQTLVLASVMLAMPLSVQAQEATPTEPVSAEEMSVLDPQERAMHEYRVRNAETQAEVDAERTQTHSRIEARQAFNADVPETMRGEFANQERSRFENLYMDAQSDQVREQTRNALKAEVQAKTQERVRVNQQDQNQVMAEGEAVKTQTQERKGFFESVFGGASAGSSRMGGRDSDRSGGGSGGGGNGGGGGGGRGGR